MLIKGELDKIIKESPFISLSDAVYQCLLDQIIYLKIPPGEKLLESRIAEQLGISRTPVKNALDRLSVERLAQKREGKTIVVSPMSKQESHLLYEARIAIEGYAAYLAATRITPQQLEKLKSLVSMYKNAGKAADPTAYAYCDHNFHAIIIKASCNKYIQHMYNNIELNILHYRNWLLHGIDSKRLQPILTRAAKYHQTIYKALELGFADMARSEIELDINGMTDVFIEWDSPPRVDLD